MKKSKKWLIMLADSFIARAVAIFLFFLAIITGVKEFFLSSNDFISKYSVPYFILSIIISIIISAIFTFYLKRYKISDSTNIDNMDNDDGVKSRLIDRIGSSRSLQIYYHDEVDVKHKYTQIKRYDVLDYSQSDYKSIRELHGINTSKESTLYIPYSESTEYKVSFKDIKIIAYDMATGQELKVECCHANMNKKLNTHNFRILFNKPLKPNQIFQIVYYIECPRELECLNATDEIMSLSLVRIKKKIENVSFYILLDSKPSSTCMYSYDYNSKTALLMPELNEDVRVTKCTQDSIGIRNDILTKFPIDTTKDYYLQGANITKPNKSMYIIEYSY